MDCDDADLDKTNVYLSTPVETFLLPKSAYDTFVKEEGWSVCRAAVVGFLRLQQEYDNRDRLNDLAINVRKLPENLVNIFVKLKKRLWTEVAGIQVWDAAQNKYQSLEKFAREAGHAVFQTFGDTAAVCTSSRDPIEASSWAQLLEEDEDIDLIAVRPLGGERFQCAKREDVIQALNTDPKRMTSGRMFYSLPLPSYWVDEQAKAALENPGTVFYEVIQLPPEKYQAPGTLIEQARSVVVHTVQPLSEDELARHSLLERSRRRGRRREQKETEQKFEISASVREAQQSIRELIQRREEAERAEIKEELHAVHEAVFVSAMLYSFADVVDKEFRFQTERERLVSVYRIIIEACLRFFNGEDASAEVEVWEAKIAAVSTYRIRPGANVGSHLVWENFMELLTQKKFTADSIQKGLWYMLSPDQLELAVDALTENPFENDELLFHHLDPYALVEQQAIYRDFEQEIRIKFRGELRQELGPCPAGRIRTVLDVNPDGYVVLRIDGQEPRQCFKRPTIPLDNPIVTFGPDRLEVVELSLCEGPCESALVSKSSWRELALKLSQRRFVLRPLHQGTLSNSERMATLYEIVSD
jgi:hypothetical protein